MAVHLHGGLPNEEQFVLATVMDMSYNIICTVKRTQVPISRLKLEG